MVEQVTVEQVKALIGQTVDGGRQQVLTAWIDSDRALVFVGRWYTVEEITANGWINETGENRALPEPVTEVLTKEMTAVDFSSLLDVLKTIGDRLDRLETRLIG